MPRKIYNLWTYHSFLSLPWEGHATGTLWPKRLTSFKSQCILWKVLIISFRWYLLVHGRSSDFLTFFWKPHILTSAESKMSKKSSQCHLKTQKSEKTCENGQKYPRYSYPERGSCEWKALFRVIKVGGVGPPWPAIEKVSPHPLACPRVCLLPIVSF